MILTCVQQSYKHEGIPIPVCPSSDLLPSIKQFSNMPLCTTSQSMPIQSATIAQPPLFPSTYYVTSSNSLLGHGTTASGTTQTLCLTDRSYPESETGRNFWSRISVRFRIFWTDSTFLTLVLTRPTCFL